MNEMERQTKREWKLKIKEIMQLSDSLNLSRVELAKELNKAGLKTKTGKEWTPAGATTYGLKRNWLQRKAKPFKRKASKRRVGRPEKFEAQTSPNQVVMRKPTEKDFIKFALTSDKLSSETKISVIQELI